MNHIRRYLVLCFLIIRMLVVFGQDLYFNQYGPDNGLTNPFIYAINQDSEGYLWIGTAEGLFKFNGLEFIQFTDQDSIAENFVTTIFKAKNGALWVGHMNGGITHYYNHEFQVITKDPPYNSTITSVTESESGLIWFSTQNEGICNIGPEMRIRQVTLDMDLSPISALVHMDDDFFLAGSLESLFILEYDKENNRMFEKMRIDDWPFSKVVSIIKESNNCYIIISQDEGVYSLLVNPQSEEYGLTTINDNSDGNLDNAQSGLLTNEKELLISTMGNGIHRFTWDDEMGDFIFSNTISNSTGLPSNDIKSLYSDREGIVWLGSYGEGLLKVVDDNIKFYSYSSLLGSGRIYSVTDIGDDLLVAAENSLLVISSANGQINERIQLPQNLKVDRINSLYNTRNGKVFIGFEKSGLYELNLKSKNFNKVFISFDDLENSINHISGEGNTIWISTKKGICKLNTQNYERNWFSTRTGLPHNNIQSTFPDSEGRLLIGTISKSVHYLDKDGKIAEVPNSQFGSLNSIITFTEERNGILWVATQGNGVYKITDKGQINYNRTSGLLSDYCYSIIFDNDRKIAVGHRGGISFIDTESSRLTTFSQNNGIKSSTEFYTNSILIDQSKIIWFGTSEGLIKYVPGMSAKGLVPPLLHIDAVYINNVRADFSRKIKLRPGIYDIRIEYTGINFSNPHLVEYETFLEGYSNSWSERTKNRRVTYERVGHGEYSFTVKAYNENDIAAITPSPFEIKVKRAIYASFWFYLFLLIVSGISLFYYIRRREALLKTAQERLIRNLDDKTKEIIVKEEIIKERKKVEKELIAAKERAELSDKLKTSFLNNMSHEIRTPMNAIVGLSELLKDPDCDSQSQKEYVGMILSNSTSLLNLLDDLIDLSRIESNQVQISYREVNLSDLFQEIFRRYQSELKELQKEHIDLILLPEKQDEKLTVKTDYVRLKQILGKLLDNAIKFTDEGRIIFGYQITGEEIEFFVEDTGIGLSPDKKEIIFELFRKIEDNKFRLYRGTGLGLALSQHIITMMGSEIKVDSKEGEGSRFYFKFPLSVNKIVQELPSVGAVVDSYKPHWPDKTFVVVEDDPSNLILISEILKSTGAKVITVTDGRSAVETVLSAKKVDLIVMDIKLPGYDGYEATRQIKRKMPHIPIIAHTAYAMEGDREKSIDAGCDDYLSKPTNRKQLILAIAKYFE